MTPKLLVVTTVPITICGFLLPFIQHFKSLGWQVDGMAQEISTNSECVVNCDRVWDIQWSRNVFDPRNLLAGVARVREVVAQGNYDLVHVHTPIASFVTRYALKNVDQPKIIYTAHGFHFYRGGNPIKNKIFFNLEKIAGAWTDYLITINQEDKTAATKYRFLPPERIYYTRGIGVDTNYYAFSQVSEADILKLRQELNLSPADSLLLSIAEFTPRKRHRDLLTALAKLNYPHVHLALAGDGPLREEMEKFTTQLGIDSQVHFLGFRTDIPTLIQASNAVLLVSQQEGLPRSIMEAMCSETPVIGTNIRGTQDLLEDGCGLLVNLGDVDEIAQAMAKIVDDPESTEIIARKGRAKMADYDIEKIILQYTEIYQLALA